MHLLDWKEVLNIVDEYMDLIIKTWRKDIILEKESNIEPSNVNPTYFEDISDLKTLLQFTINLLGNCVQKDAYNSAEVSNYDKNNDNLMEVILIILIHVNYSTLLNYSMHMTIS